MWLESEELGQGGPFTRSGGTRTREAKSSVSDMQGLR